MSEGKHTSGTCIIFENKDDLKMTVERLKEITGLPDAEERLIRLRHMPLQIAVLMHFGLIKGAQTDSKSIGRALGISPERVDQTVYRFLRGNHTHTHLASKLKE